MNHLSAEERMHSPITSLVEEGDEDPERETSSSSQTASDMIDNALGVRSERRHTLPDAAPAHVVACNVRRAATRPRSTRLAR